MTSPFLNHVRHEMRIRQFSIRTEKAYLYWIRMFIRQQGYRHPESMGCPEVRAFLGYLADQRAVAQATQRLALNALVFLYAKVLNKPLGDIGYQQASKPRRVPTVLTASEANAVLTALPPVHHARIVAADAGWAVCHASRSSPTARSPSPGTWRER